MLYFKSEKWLKRWLLFTIAGFLSLAAKSQNNLTIEECYRLARENYPLVKKADLIAKTSQYTVENAGKGYLPQLSFSGQASYQSQTINFADVLPPQSGIHVPPLSKDQYKIQGEVSQQIYDGGLSQDKAAYTKASEAIQQQNLEVNLYALKDRVTQLYFSVLLMDEQYRQNELRKSDLKNEVSKAEASLKNGAAYRSSVDELKAELAGADMTGIEFKANRQTYLQILSVLIGKTVADSAYVSMPVEKTSIPEIRRPELQLYDLQKKAYDVQEKQLRSDYMPRLNAFFQEAYGRPTLNIIENNFGFWYITGIRLNWSLGSLYTLKNNKRILNLDRQSTDIDKETFLKNTNLDLTRENGNIKKYRRLIQQDDQAIQLRASVKKSAQAQLANGVITIHEYIAQVNAENLARQTQILHHIQLLQAQYQYSNISGN
jgi:outer membrane protein TolC